MKQLILLTAILFLHNVTYAQVDSVQELREVNIREYRLQSIEETAKTTLIDSSLLLRITSSSLASISNHSGAFIKDNGGGRLATISIRGTTASQNSVYWNGLSINTPTFGLFDLSLFPVFFADRVSIQYGGNGSLNGSDAIGGAVTVSSIATLNKGMQAEVLLNTGSFGLHEEGVKLMYSDDAFSTKTAFYLHDAQNNFKVKREGQPDYEQSNAASSQRALLQEITYIKNQNSISTHLMMLDARHETPALLSSASRASGQVQHDNQLRLVTRWKQDRQHFGFLLSAGMLADKIHYSDTAISLYDYSFGRSFQGNGEVHYTQGKHSMLLGATARLSDAFVKSSPPFSEQGYPERRNDRQESIYINYRMQQKKLLLMLSLRYDAAMKESVPLIPAAGFAYTFIPSLSLKGNVAAIYRNPTLNDLYWRPGGNQNLLPENGYQGDVFLQYEKQSGFMRGIVSAGIFYLNIENYIQWLPGADNIYSPVNEDRISSRGMELSLSESLQLQQWQLRINGNVQYIHSARTVGGADLFASFSENQLPYIPRLQWNVSAEVRYRNTSLLLSSGYTGHRYLTYDNAYWLQPFISTQVGVSHEILFSQSSIIIAGSISNLQDINYEVIAQRPVAGRAFKISLLYRYR